MKPWAGTTFWWGCSSVGRASNRHTADTGSIPRCGKGFFSQSQLSVLVSWCFEPSQPQRITSGLHLSMQTLLHVSVHPRLQSYALSSARTLQILQSMSRVRWIIGNIKTPSKHRRLSSATLSQLAFPAKQPEFPMEEIPMGQYRRKKNSSS